jgi:hypothetical protein
MKCFSPNCEWQKKKGQMKNDFLFTEQSYTGYISGLHYSEVLGCYTAWFGNSLPAFREAY